MAKGWVPWEGRQVMGASGGDRHEYTAASAKLYGSIGIEGTTYEIGFDAVRELLGDIRDKTFLDFGCGAGRSTAFLMALGAGPGTSTGWTMTGTCSTRRSPVGSPGRRSCPAVMRSCCRRVG